MHSRSTLLVSLALASLLASPALAGTPSPDDWRDLAIYQVFTDRFFNGDPANDAVEGFYNPSDGVRNHGGDWAGVEQKLDYIQGLGYTAIWISPVQTNVNAAYHGYHIRNFYGISAHCGGITALRSLVDACHARGMYVILDVITNHGGDLIDSGDPGWDAFENPGTYTLRWRNPAVRHAPPFDDLSMFHNNGGIDIYQDPNQILGELAGLDDLRTEDPAIRAELIAAHQWLIRETDADGFRIDTVKHVEIDFWEVFAPALRSYAADSLGKDNFFMYGEVFDGSSLNNGLFTGTQNGGAFSLDATLWFPMHFTSRFVFRDGGAPSDLTAVYADSTFYDPAARTRLVNFLDNHDVGRFQGFQSGAERDDAKGRIALVWQHTSLGIPCVYYGMEQEFDGGGDPYNREDMFDGQWDFGPSLGDNFDPTTPHYRALRRLNELRQALPALRRGAQEDVFVEGGSPGIYAYVRRMAGNDDVFVVLNNDSESHTLTFTPDLTPGTWVDQLSGRAIVVPASGSVELVAGGLSAAVFTAIDVPAAPWIEGTWPAHDGALRDPAAGIRISFNQPMNRTTTEAAITVSPPVSWTSRWMGNTLVLETTAPMASFTTYTVTVGASATAFTGTPLGHDASFFFRTESPVGGISVPSGYTANPIPNFDLNTPLSLETGVFGSPFAGRLLLGDTGWDRVLDFGDRGFIQARVVDAINRPASIALDVPGGAFGGDLLIADTDQVRRVVLGGLSAGSVEVLGALPNALDWIVAVDPTGAYGGDAFVGRPGDGTLRRVGPTGGVTTFLTGLGSVAGITFGSGGFGSGLLVLTSGSVLAVSPAGATTPVATNGLLAGATSLAVDPLGAFGADLFTTRSSSGQILRITPAGAVSTFAGGFAGFPGGDALAFGPVGDLYVVESDGSTRRVVKIAPSSLDSIVTGVEEPEPVLGIGLQLAGPNPFTSSTAFRVAVPVDGPTTPVRLAVYDVSGREVRLLVDEENASAAERTVTWDGRDDRDRRLPTGVYLVRLRYGASREEIRKVTLVR